MYLQNLGYTQVHCNDKALKYCIFHILDYNPSYFENTQHKLPIRNFYSVYFSYNSLISKYANHTVICLHKLFSIAWNVQVSERNAFQVQCKGETLRYHSYFNLNPHIIIILSQCYFLNNGFYFLDPKQLFILK